MKKVLNVLYFLKYDQVKFHALLSWAWKKFYNLGAWTVSSSTKPSTSGLDNSVKTGLWRHSDKNSAAMNNPYLDFVQTLFTWINIISQG